MIDCDLNFPTMPCPTPYDGSILKAANFLISKRPRGWKEELGKLKSMRTAAVNPNKLDQRDWPIRFRLISPGVVLPQQVVMTLFVSMIEV